MYIFMLWLFPALLCEYVSSTPSNVTIDDQNGDPSTGVVPTYAPASAWSQGSQCTGCLAQPDASQAFDQTWHDSTAGNVTVPYTMSVPFKGTAVYVFCILANQIQFATTTTFLSFNIDGDIVGPSFTHDPDSTQDYIYNALVFSTEGLSDANHNLVMSSQVMNGQNSLVLFDYVIYTTDPDSNPSSPVSSSPLSSSPPLQTTSTTPEKPPTSSASASSTPSSIASNEVTKTSSISNPLSTLALSSGANAQTFSTSSTAVTSSSIESLPTPSSVTAAARPLANHISAIVGGVVGGITGAAVFGLLAWLCKRRSRRDLQHRRPRNSVLTPHTPWSEKAREDTPVFNITSPEFAGLAGTENVVGNVASSRGALRHEVRELEEQIAELESAGGLVSQSASQLYTASNETETERLQGQIRDLQATVRQLAEQSAPPIYVDDRRLSVG